MSAKTLLPNQHNYLHPFYGQENCCLCKAEFRIRDLEKEVERLKSLHENVVVRKAKVRRTSYPPIDGTNPLALS